MRDKIRLVVSRAKFAAIGAAVGAALGGLVSRNLASTGGAMGALAGAVIGEKRASVESLVEDVKERDVDVDPGALTDTEPDSEVSGSTNASAS